MSSLTADPVTIVADGQTTSTLLFTLKDKQGNRIPGQTVVFTTGLAGITLRGVAFAVAPVTVKLIADSSKPDKGKSSLSATPRTIVADGSAISVLKLDLRDVNNNAVPGQTVIFTTALTDTADDKS